MKKLILTILAITLLSCNQNQENQKKYFAQSTPMATIKISYERYFNSIANDLTAYSDYYKYTHRKEILKTLTIAKVISVKNTNIKIVFYSYSIGSVIIRYSNYMKLYNGKYYFGKGYYSSYDDDPFKNGHPVEAKKLIDEVDNWRKDNENIEWYN
jgi:hypothetical protein